jgi:hypothetical protein
VETISTSARAEDERFLMTFLVWFSLEAGPNEPEGRAGGTRYDKVRVACNKRAAGDKVLIKNFK